MRAHVIGHAQLGAVRIAKIEFRKIAVEMLLAAMLVRSDHAALEDREHALDGVGGCRSAGVRSR